MAPKLAAVYEVSVCLATHRVVSAVTRGWVGAVPLRIACSHALLASCAWCQTLEGLSAYECPTSPRNAHTG